MTKPASNNVPLLWTVNEAADCLAVSPGHIRRLIRDQKIQAIRVGDSNGRLYITVDEVRRYQESHPVVGRKGK